MQDCNLLHTGEFLSHVAGSDPVVFPTTGIAQMWAGQCGSGPDDCQVEACGSGEASQMAPGWAPSAALSNTRTLGFLPINASIPAGSFLDISHCQPDYRLLKTCLRKR